MGKMILSELNKKNLVAQKNTFISSSYKMTAKEVDVLDAFSSLISPEDLDFNTLYIPLREISKALGVHHTTAERQFDETTDRLMTRFFKVMRKGGGWDKFHIISNTGVVDGNVYLKFHEDFKPVLLGLKKDGNFTQTRLFISLSFKSVYTKIIYKQLVMNYSKKIVSFEIELSELRNQFLGVGSKAYPLYKNFRNKVLDVAKKELLQKNKETGCFISDFGFEMEVRRTDRKISHIRFNVIKNPVQDPLPFEDLPEPQVVLPVISVLKGYGISEPVANKFLEEQGEESILRCIELYKNALQAGKVQNKSGAYLMKMLQAEAGKENQADKHVEEEAQKKQEVEAEKAKIVNRDELINNLSKAFRKQEISRYLSELTEQEQFELLTEAKQENTLIKSLTHPIAISFLTAKIPDYEENKYAYIENGLG